MRKSVVADGKWKSKADNSRLLHCHSIFALTDVTDDGPKRTKCANRKHNATKNKCACNNKTWRASNKRSKHDLRNNNAKCRWSKRDCVNNKSKSECNNSSSNSSNNKSKRDCANSKNKSECSSNKIRSECNSNNNNKPSNVAAWRKNNACA